jgi:hypothetical protein
MPSFYGFIFYKDGESAQMGSSLGMICKNMMSFDWQVIYLMIKIS